MRPHPLGRFGALVASAITVAVLVGCNGSTGPAGPAGTSSSSTPSTGYVVDAATISASDWIALNPKGQITSASVNAAGNPVVNFTITDGKGNPVKGLDLFTMHVANDPDGSYTLPNFYFEIAKLVPPPAGTPSAPSKWVSYIVNSAANKAHASAPQAPNSDVYGTLAGAGARGSPRAPRGRRHHGHRVAAPYGRRLCGTCCRNGLPDCWPPERLREPEAGLVQVRRIGSDPGRDDRRSGSNGSPRQAGFTHGPNS